MEGWYYDPKHGGCLRRVVCSGSRFTILGVYGSDESPRTHQSWTADVTVVGRGPGDLVKLVVNFTGKVKRKKMHLATYVARTIRWDDGNVWLQLYVHPSQLLCTTVQQ